MRQPSGLPTPFHNLPIQPTSFVGRTGELAELTQLLAGPACRLLTLIGMGGIGKTRLALQVAAEVQAKFADGVYFVPLQAVQSTDFLISAIADALNLPLMGQDDPWLQVLNYLRDKELLLVLDNFEQLLSPPSIPPSGGEDKGPVDLIYDLLQATPAVKLLVTSREVLKLQEEWLYDVQGLPFPEFVPGSPLDRGGFQPKPSVPLSPVEPGANVGQEVQPEVRPTVESYGAVQLFVERAQRVRRNFSLADEQTEVVRICQLVGGAPLAVELAATWTKSLSCAAIAAEIQRNLDFLATNLRNVPDRQRSVRAVFNHSWQSLTQSERDVFKRLSVFRGGFRREAAERVAGASLAMLAALVDKSLLQWELDGRYQIHELLRQYAAEQLVQSAEDVAQIYDRHCAYYADFLEQRLRDMWGGRQIEAIAEIKADLENMRAAWQWAVELVKIEEIQKSIEALNLFYYFQSRYLEGVAASERVVQLLMQTQTTRQTDLILLKIRQGQVWYYIRLGWLEKAEATLAYIQVLYRQLNIPPYSGYTTDPLLALGIIASIRGDYAMVAQLGDQALRTSEIHPHIWNRRMAYYLLARAALLQGQYESAQQYAQQAYAITKEIDDRWFMAYCLGELGNVARALGNYATAREHYEASYALRAEFADPEGMALALTRLGEIALLQGAYPEAEQLYQQSRVIYEQINDRGGLAAVLNGLANLALVQGDYQAAQPLFQQALQIATDIQFTPLILSILIGAGELLLRTGRAERGLALLGVGLTHPASDQELKTRVHSLLARDGLDPQPDHGSSGANDLETVVQTTQVELAQPIQSAGLESPPAPASSLYARPSVLVEPLSERELEVLRYIAAGLQNGEIATELFVTLSTVKTHINNIYRKLDVSNRVQAVSRAKELNLL